MSEQIEDHMATLSDAELERRIRVARDDLAEAANTEKDSEWHQACFAGFIAYAHEAKKRGIRITELM